MQDKVIHSNALKLDDLLAAPFLAAARADAQMSQEQLQQIINTCFESHTREDGTEVKKPIHVDMVLERKVIVPSEDAKKEVEQQTSQMVLSVPLLTLLPMSSLSITKVSLDYSLEIVSQLGKKSTNTKQASQTSNGSSGAVKPSIRATVANKSKQNSSQTEQSSTKSQLDVTMEASQTPLPEGVKILVEAFSKSLNTSK